jgi:hypothetical protein
VPGGILLLAIKLSADLGIVNGFETWAPDSWCNCMFSFETPLLGMTNKAVIVCCSTKLNALLTARGEGKTQAVRL